MHRFPQVEMRALPVWRHIRGDAMYYESSFLAFVELLLNIGLNTTSKHISLRDLGYNETIFEVVYHELCEKMSFKDQFIMGLVL